MNSNFAGTEQDNVVAGPERRPRNSAINAGAGSIHDDATAKKLGFRGGTVAGSLHMEQFPPLLMHLLGKDWQVTGSQSLYFKYATTDGEPVQAFAEKPAAQTGDRQIRVWMNDPAGQRICDGTASVGKADMSSEVRQRIKAVREPSGLRILADVELNKRGPVTPTRIAQSVQDERLAVITEPLAAYTDAAEFGGKLVTPALQVRLMRPGEAALLRRTSHYGVGLFGAIELQMLQGPVFVERDYETWATILAVGETPKTEFFYYESNLADPKSGNEIMRMLMMIRFMKASSALYQ